MTYSQRLAFSNSSRNYAGSVGIRLKELTFGVRFPIACLCVSLQNVWLRDTVVWLRDTVVWLRDTVVWLRDTVVWLRDTVVWLRDTVV